MCNLIATDCWFGLKFIFMNEKTNTIWHFLFDKERERGRYGENEMHGDGTTTTKLFSYSEMFF